MNAAACVYINTDNLTGISILILDSIAEDVAIITPGEFGVNTARVGGIRLLISRLIILVAVGII